MRQQTRDFIETWTKRIASFKGNDLGTLFDKYSGLYTLYNRLYNESFQELKNSDKLEKPRYSDFEKATLLVIKFNSAEDIIKHFKKHNNFTDLETIADLIRNDIFHINLVDGVVEKDFDIQLMKNLQSADDDIKAQAVFSTIYNVRCNMLHGEKHFQEHQRILLEPLIRILETVVTLQIDKLK